jgi:hypothetical protein
MQAAWWDARTFSLVAWRGACSLIYVKNVVLRFIHPKSSIGIDGGFPLLAALQEGRPRLIRGLRNDAEAAGRKPWEGGSIVLGI